MTRPFSEAFKRKIIARLTGKDAISANELAAETGLHQQTLSRWLREASSLPLMSSRRPRTKSLEDKFRILATASTLTGTELQDWLAREGVHHAEYEQWRLGVPGARGGRGRRHGREVRGALMTALQAML